MSLIELTRQEAVDLDKIVSFLIKADAFYTTEELQKKQEMEQKAEVSKLEFEQLTLNVQDLRNKFFDYDDVKQRVKRNEIREWIAIVLSLIAIALSIILKG